MLVLGVRLLRGKLLQSDLRIVAQPSLIIGGEDDGGDVHRIDEGQSRLHPALIYGLVHLFCDVDDRPPALGVGDQFLSMTFHVPPPPFTDTGRGDCGQRGGNIISHTPIIFQLKCELSLTAE